MIKTIQFIISLAIILVSCKSNQSAFKWHNLNSEIFPFYEDGLWGYNYKDGSKLIEAQYEEAYLPKHGLIKVKKNGKYGFIDEKGNQRIRCKYTEASEFHLSDKFTYPPKTSSRVQIKNKIYYIDEFGNKTPAIWKDSIEINSISKSLTVNQSLEDKVLSINNFNELIFSYQIENDKGEISTFIDTTNLNLDTVYLDNSVFVCKKNRKYGILFSGQLNGIPADGNPFQKHIYREGEYLPKIQFLFDDLETVNNRQNQDSQFYFKAMKGGNWGIVNIGGVTIVPFQYLSIKHIEQNRFALVEYDKNKFGYLSIKSEHSQDEKNTYSYEEHFKK